MMRANTVRDEETNILSFCLSKQPDSEYPEATNAIYRETQLVGLAIYTVDTHIEYQ